MRANGLRGVPDRYSRRPQHKGFQVPCVAKPDSIGDRINKKIIAPLANANKLADMPDFNDATKLCTGKEMADKLANLIAIFEDPALVFSGKR